MANYAEMIREEFQKGDDIRDAGLTTPEDIIRYDNIPYGKDPKWNLLDIYRPKQAKEKKLPVIVNVHGGGLVYGTKETYQFYCMSLAQHGFAVVNYNYRLAPEHKFPAALDDECKVFNWVLEHAEKYDLDTEHVFAVGDSAGGTLLGQFCNLCTNLDYAAKLPTCIAPQNFVPVAVALNCGDYQYTKEEVPVLENTDEEPDLIQSLLPFIFENKGSDEELALGSVIGNVTSSFPPAYVMSCQDDFLKYQMLVLCTEFVKKDVPYMSEFYVSSKERLGHVFHCNIKDELAIACNASQIRFFKEMIQIKDQENKA